METIVIKAPQGGRRVGPGSPVFIIAEAGANWHISSQAEKNKKQTFRLIDIAVGAGADAVKFQLYGAARLYSKQAGYANYLGRKEAIYKIIKDRELPSAWLAELKRYCDRRGIIFLCTPFDEKSVDELEKINVAAYKIASYEISHLPLIKYIAAKKKPIIFSTGAANLKDIAREARTIKNAGNEQYAILQCTAKYPAPLSAINLQVIPELIKKFKVPVGLSDHSREPAIAPLGAVALGAKIIEKHFTTDNNLPGPDHIFAALPFELADMVRQIRMLESALGARSKNIQKEEKELYYFCRRALYVKKNIKQGELFSWQNITALRPGKGGKGLLAQDWNKVIGKPASKDMGFGLPITRNSVGN
jgi:N-acetylneuraminate synthase